MNIQDCLALLRAAESIEQEEEAFAVAQEELSAEEYSMFTAIAPESKFLDHPEFNR